MVQEDVKASEAGALVHAGAAKAEMFIESPGGEGRINIPPGRYSSKGERPPRASRYALGLDSLVNLDPKERAKALADYLKTVPTKDDLAAAFVDRPPEVVEKIWKGVETLGWDGAHERAKETGAKLKGQWEAVSGENFGTQKITNFVPEGWSDDLASASLESLTADIAQAKEFLKAAVSHSAVSSEERARLNLLTSNLPVLKGRVAEAEAEVQHARAAEERAGLASASGRVKDLEHALTAQRETLKTAQAVAERKAIETQALGATVARSRLTEATKELEKRKSGLKEAQERRNKLGELGDAIEIPHGTVCPCPHCKKPVSVIVKLNRADSSFDTAERGTEGCCRERQGAQNQDRGC